MVSLSRVVRAPATDVLEVLADGWTYASWVVGTSRIRAVDTSFPAPGSRIHHSVGAWPLLLDDETVVRAWDPDRGIEMQARGWPFGEARVRVTVAPSASGAECTVRLDEDASRGPGRFVPKPVRSALLTPRNRETLRRLALAAEGHARRAERRGP
ncbi:SRPBCC family protein [Cellulosimicrobium sp. CUA-896]|uniref:SRPBCC family protein n=1 Tax=Cellulosimicrobium sp. CUA-896 TaxID=1517881 RepID=UPI000962F08B|nr:SRPBCC family protein [Cellulosimicrobium sp. CUA-896]OLT55139.1 polyketide cyclase [Cellulosimicrobium sp. CUA-896]